MRQDTVNLIRNYYDAFNRGDLPTFLGLLAEDVVHEVNQGGAEKGKPAFATFMAKMNAHYRERVVDLVVLASDDGRRAAAEFKVDGTYLESAEGLPAARGQPYLLPVGAFFEIRAGKVARLTNYYNLPSWIAMVSK